MFRVPTGHVPHASCTLGIDLASQPEETGVCQIDWSRTPATVVDLGSGVLDDSRLLDLMTNPIVGKIGLDAPFGWPLAFVDAVATYRDHGKWLDLAHEEVRFRATELVVRDVTSQPPLSVATSDLAWPAIRLARLLTQLAADREPIDRAGSGRFAEVYPAAALRRWEVIPPGTSIAAAAYKGGKPGRPEARLAIMSALRSKLEGQVDVDEAVAARCIADDDDLDAFVSALVARVVQVGRSAPIPPGMRWAALREGWIHLPDSTTIELSP